MSAYLDILFLLIIVGLIFFRLRRVLGTRPEGTHPRIIIVRKPVSEQEVAEVVKQALSEKTLSPIEQTLAVIPNFSKQDFYTRCSKAFEMILKAFAEADEDTLKMLMTKRLFGKFQEIIRTRQTEGITAETDLIRIENIEIEKADISAKGVAKVVVRLISEQINLLKNKAGEVIEGDENFIQKITDIWTFERNLNNNSPVWLLASTKK